MVDFCSGTIVLVRHGETVHNGPNPIITGTINIELAETGREQARNLSQFLIEQGIIFDRAYSSSLGRTIETTRLILGQGSLIRLEAVSELDERNWGLLQGLTFSVAHEEYSDRDWDIIDSWGGAPTGGESYAQMHKRIYPFLEYKILSNAADGETVLVVGHTEMLKVIRRALENVPYEETSKLRMGNCDAILYRINNTGSVIDYRALN